ncbi:hypothetical protein [Nocardioides sp. TF02-7]|uniref:hypothetical protein n=1 Tax=Nocardioides sp. TF02-7 TaxID=2917724 RepID=UPI001F053BB1|nr:hypothetical protein [Nocardioides sp. TF02-7]UMG94537.1 hypothetical protein MF408_11560 [Nocardioides sp. TF02-7]
MTRSALAALAVVLATLLVPAAVTASWLSLRVEDTDAYVDTVAPLADDPVLRRELGDRVTEAAVGRLRSAVPPGLAGSLEAMVRSTTASVVESPAFPEFWRQANADVHEQFLAVVHERPDTDTDIDTDTDTADTGGWVTVDLRPLVEQVLRTYAADNGLPEGLVRAPELRVPVLPESRLVEARGGYRALEGLAFWLPLGWAALVALAVVVARGMRGRLRTAAAAAAGAALGAALLLPLTDVGADLVVDRAGADQRDLVRLVVEVVAGTLDDTARWVAVGGGVTAAVLLVVSLVVPARGGRRSRPAENFHP